MSIQEELSEKTYMLDTASEAEMSRLLDQEHVLTGRMGLLPPGLHLHDGDRVLDVACGPAGWARTLAAQYPAVRVLGVDISQSMLAYASAASGAQHLPNISFRHQDVTKPWELADASFDLVNARLMVGFLSGEKWQHAIAEMLRVLVPGGTIVLTESDGSHTNSPALETLSLYAYRSAKRAGVSQHPLGHHMGLTPLLGHYLQRAGVAEIQQEAHVIDFSAGAAAHCAVAEDFKSIFKQVQPYIVRQGIAGQQELEELYERFLDELEAPDFCALWYVLRIRGKKPA